MVRTRPHFGYGKQHKQSGSYLCLRTNGLNHGKELTSTRYRSSTYRRRTKITEVSTLHLSSRGPLKRVFMRNLPREPLRLALVSLSSPTDEEETAKMRRLQSRIRYANNWMTPTAKPSVKLLTVLSVFFCRKNLNSCHLALTKSIGITVFSILGDKEFFLIIIPAARSRK